MTDSKDQAQSLFLNALEIPTEGERAAYVEAQCGADPELRKEVEELLDHARRLGPFLDPGEEGVDGAIAHPISERPGAVIGPYKLLQQIGEGGMGVVFMAEQTEPIQRTVGLKIIKPGMDTRQVIARFEAERQALALMDHPNIARVLDVGATDAGRPYFVMDLVKGVPITDYCDQQHLPIRARLELVSAVCRAVQHAHQKGIIHRDLKPSNVLVAEYDGRPVPKIIDFGVAKATAQRLTEKTMFTELGQMVGTVEYMSPEQARFNQLDVDTRSDIYSLGVLVYELLTGTTPFGRKRLNEAAFDEMLRIIREEEPPKPSTRLSSSDALPSIAANRGLEPLKLNRLVQGELDWIVMKALEKDRNRRYETASNLAADIGHYLHDEPVAARPASNLYRFRKTVRRNKIAFGAASAVVAALVVGLGLSTWLFVRERAARQRAVAAERLAEIDKQTAKTEAAKSELVAQFMTDMLKGVGPWVALGRDTTMLREILDQTAERLNELKGQPAVEADLRATLGSVYNDIGECTSAAAMYREALALRQMLFGDEHPDVAASFFGLADALSRQDRFAEAEPLFRQALAMRRKLLGEEHPDLANTLLPLARSLRRQGKHAEAEDMLREALEMRRKVFGSDHPKLASPLYNLGRALHDQGKLSDAEAHYRQALSQKSSDKSTFPPAACIIVALVRVLDDQEKPDDVTAIYRDAIEMSPNSAETYNELAWMLATNTDLQLADPARAVELAKKAVELAPQDGNIWNTLGVAQYRAGMSDDAVRSLTKAEELLPGKSLAFNGFFLAMANEQLGHKDDARKWYVIAVEWMEKNNPNNDYLRRFRAEAAELLGITEPKSESASVQPADHSAKADTPITTSQPTTDD